MAEGIKICYVEYKKKLLERLMIKLYEYLISNYKPNEPIFVSDLQISISDANLQQMFNLLCDSERLRDLILVFIISRKKVG